MNHFFFIIVIVAAVFTRFSPANAQGNSSIDINCPSWGTENRLPPNSSNRLLFIGKQLEDERDLSLFAVDELGISEVRLPTPKDGSTREYSLSPLGTRIAYFEFNTSDRNASHLTIFDISAQTMTQFAVGYDVASRYDISWTDDTHVALTPKHVVTGNEEIVVVDVVHSTIELAPVSAPLGIQVPFAVDYAPHLNLYAFLGSDSLGIARSDGTILFSSQTFDYYNSLTSIAWSENQHEVLLYTDGWYIFSDETQALTAINTPSSYKFPRSGVWSPHSRFIAFTGFRLPEDRPNIFSELITYDRFEEKFIDYCQVGDFLIYGSNSGMTWSTDSAYFAYTLKVNQELNLYILDTVRSTISKIDLASTGETIEILGWQRENS